MNNTLQAKLVTQLEKHPDRRALTFVNSNGEFSWQTFEQVYSKASAYAANLSQLGIGRGDICILVLPSKEFCATMLIATLLINAVPLLVAPPTLQGFNTYLLQVLQRLIRKTRAKLVVASASMQEMQEELKGIRKQTKVIFGEAALHTTGKLNLPLPFPDENDIAGLQLTSGTTGFPRVCIWQQKNVIAALDGMVQAMHLTDKDVCLNWTPLYHDMGLVNNFFTCLTNGLPLAMLNPMDFVKNPSLWLRSLTDTGATVTWSPNFGFAITTKWARDSELEGVRLEHVKGFWNAAERIHLDTITAFYERFAPYGVKYESLKTNFGCAENVGGATFSDPDGTFPSEWVDTELLHQKRIARVTQHSGHNGKTTSVVGVGRPHPGIRIKILSKRGRELPDGHVGEIALDTPSRMTGYMGNARETNKATRGGFLRTGDLGYLRGDELFWVGRVKERITIRGKKLDPSDFERVLLNIPGLRPGCFVAFGVDNHKTGTQKIVIVSEVRNAGTSRPYSEISEDIREQVSLQLGVPVSETVLVPKGTLTKTSSGKRRHRYFRDLYLNGQFDSIKFG